MSTIAPSTKSDNTTVLSGRRRSSILVKDEQEIIETHLTKVPTSLQAAPSEDTPRTRNLVLCLDGTGDTFDADNSNVVFLCAALRKDDPTQKTYYATGIGTTTRDGRLKTGIKGGISAAVDMAIGSGLGDHIKDAYKFLMANYQEGDRICLFGFSRGAYTARALAGMLHKVGLLPAHNVEQVPFAYKQFKDDTDEGWKMSAMFKKTYSIDVDVYFLGLWDTVGSVGFIPRVLPFAKTDNDSIRYARHAMALDERRAKFKVASLKHRAYDRQAEKKESDEEKAEKFQRAEGRQSKTDMLEVYFAGGHADVGGGAQPNESRHKMSNVPLRWMIRQTFLCGTGILYKTETLAELGIDVHTLWPRYQPRSIPFCGPPPSALERYEAGTLPSLANRARSIGRRRRSDPPLNGLEMHAEEGGEVYSSADGLSSSDWLSEDHEDHFDALAGPICDMLAKPGPWWILEFWPVKRRVQSESA